MHEANDQNNNNDDKRSIVDEDLPNNSSPSIDGNRSWLTHDVMDDNDNVITTTTRPVSDVSPSPGLTSGVVINDGISSTAHPLIFARTLMQLGYEPMPPFKAPSMFGFGRSYLYMPNIITYLKYIHAVDGASGLYRGVGRALLGRVTLTVATKQMQANILSKMNPGAVDVFMVTVSGSGQADSVTAVINKTIIEISAKTWGVIISHPFCVMSTRCMAQFIAGETKYSSFNVFHNAAVIYEDNGLSGFFVGIFPRLAWEISNIVLFNMIVSSIRTLLANKDLLDMDNLIMIVSKYFVNSITYPLSIVTTVACVNNSGLAAGCPPFMPVYANWIDTLNKLSDAGQLKRGAAMFGRPYIRSQTKYPALHS